MWVLTGLEQVAVKVVSAFDEPLAGQCISARTSSGRKETHFP